MVTHKYPDDVAAYLQRSIPLLSAYKPLGWVDFREGYGRGARFGVFVKEEDTENGTDPIRMKAVFDRQPEAESAVRSLSLMGLPAELSGDGLISVFFSVSRDWLAKKEAEDGHAC